MTRALDHRLIAVKVYPNRAELAVEARTHLEPGQHTLHFEGLSPHLEAKSFRLEAYGNGLVQSVQHKKVYRDLDNPYQQEPNELRKHKTELEQQLAALADEAQILAEERKAILANQVLPPSEKGGTHVTELKALAEYIRTRLADIALRLRQARTQTDALSLELSRVTTELDQLTHPTSVMLDAAVVRFEATQAGEFYFLLKYICSGAGWSPRYDIRVESTEAPAQIHFQASVTNRTEVDWLGLPIALSTAQPTQSGALPQLPSWYIREFDLPPPAAPSLANALMSGAMPFARKKARGAAEDADEHMDYELELDLEEAQTAADRTVASKTTLAQEYFIDIPFDIPSGGKPVHLPVARYEPPTKYTHFAVPKLDTAAYLQATLEDWAELNLLPGPANVFLEGDYVGETDIRFDPEHPELHIGLGRDSQVHIKYAPKHESTGKSFFGGTLKRLFGYEALIRNQKESAIRLHVEDHIPVSRHHELKVELHEGHGARLDEATGKLTWLLELPAGEACTLSFRYEVRYPRDFEVDWGAFSPGA